MPVQNTEDQWMQDVFWCYYCCFQGFGVTSKISPGVHQDLKICCFELETRSGLGFCEGGCIHSRAKTCCCVAAHEYPPSMDIGMAFCGVKCMGGRDARRVGGGDARLVEIGG